MITTLADGSPTPYCGNLDTTGEVTLVPADDKLHRRIEALSVSSAAIGSTFTLVFSRTADDFYVYNAFDIPANETLFLNDYPLPLKKGESLKVQAGTADQLSVIAIMADIYPVRDKPAVQFAPAGAQR